MSAFKTYVIREVTEKGAVFHREVQLATLEDYQKANEDRDVKLLNTMSTDELHNHIKANEGLHKMLTSTAIHAGGIFRKVSLSDRVKSFIVSSLIYTHQTLIMIAKFFERKINRLSGWRKLK